METKHYNLLGPRDLGKNTTINLQVCENEADMYWRGAIDVLEVISANIATSERCLQTLCGKYGFSICDASKLLSLAPAKLLGVDNEMGSIAVGKAAVLVLADRNFQVTAVFLDGEKVFS